MLDLRRCAAPSTWRVAINLLDLGSYLDRLQMLVALSQRVGRLYLLTDALPEAAAAQVAAAPRLRVVVLGQRGFRPRAHAWLQTRVAAGELDVIHDTFGHLSALFQALGPDPHREVRLLTTQYTTNWGWFTRVRRGGMNLDLRYVGQRLVSLHRDRRVATSADRVLVLGPGHEVDLFAGHGVAAGRVEWIPSEVDTALFHPAEVPRDARPTLLYTGTIFRNKGIDVLLEAVAAIRPRWPALRLTLLGKIIPWETAWLRQCIDRTGLGDAVELPGLLPRGALIEAYRRADLYVFPSRFEGSPRSVREALACGCPAVVSDIPGHRGIDPRAEFLRFVGGHSVGAWVEALVEALEASDATRARWGSRGAEWMRAAHAPDAVATRLLDVYRRLLASPPWSELVAEVNQPVDAAWTASMGDRESHAEPQR